MFEDFIGGAILEASETDYNLGAAIAVPEKPLYRFEDQRIAFNQATLDPYGCCRYGPATCVANNWGVDRTEEDWQWFRDNAPRYGWKPVQGMKLGAGADMVVERLNILFPGEGRTKSVVSVNTDATDELRAKGWMVQIGSFINKSYRSQISKGVIISPRGKDGSGHCRSLLESEVTSLPYIEENYKGKIPYNTIEIDCREEMKEDGQLYMQGFILYPTHKNMTPIPENIIYMTEAEASAIENSNPGLYVGLTETVRTWKLYAEQGMPLSFTNYKGLVGVSKMVQDIRDYRKEKAPSG